MVLIDTNVLSELARPVPNVGVVEWAERQSRVALSVITVDEVSFGIAAKPNRRISEWFDEFLAELCEVFPVTEEVARASGQIRGQLRTRGKTRTQADMLIAATALVHGMTLVTRNVRDFEDCGIALLNPWR